MLVDWLVVGWPANERFFATTTEEEWSKARERKARRWEGSETLISATTTKRLHWLIKSSHLIDFVSNDHEWKVSGDRVKLLRFLLQFFFRRSSYQLRNGIKDFYVCSSRSIIRAPDSSLAWLRQSIEPIGLLLWSVFFLSSIPSSLALLFYAQVLRQNPSSVQKQIKLKPPDTWIFSQGDEAFGLWGKQPSFLSPWLWVQESAKREVW